MKNYTYQNDLIGKKQLRQLLGWSFTNYDSMRACSLADELKYLGFKYATQAGISISIEDLKIPFVKNLMLKKSNQEIQDAEKIYFQGKITDVERFQKIIDTWSLTSESLKDQIVYYFKNYDPLNSVYIMAFSGARGNLSQVRQLVGMRGLMSDPSGQIMNLPIKKNFREGLTITDYLMSGYGARKGIVDTALKTANSGYLTRRLIDVAQDILIREKDCLTNQALLFSTINQPSIDSSIIHESLLGKVLNQNLVDTQTGHLIAKKKTQITPELIQECKKLKIQNFYVRSPLTCNLYRAICQNCYGWDLAHENLVDIGEAIGILAGQSIGEPGTQLTMRTFHTGGIFTSEARKQIISPFSGVIQFYKFLKTVLLRTNRGEDVLVTKNSGFIILIPDNPKQDIIQIEVLRNTILFPKNNQYILKDTVIGELINTNKQIKTEVKSIVSDTCGEIFIPTLKQRVNLVNNNQLIWLLSGQLYNGPKESFLNFQSDYKLNSDAYIFRTKIMSHYPGLVSFMNQKNNLDQQLLHVDYSKYVFSNSKLQKLNSKNPLNYYLLTVNNYKYFVKVQPKNEKFYLQLTRRNKFATFLSNLFRTLTGGILYYDSRSRNPIISQQNLTYYYHQINQSNKYFSISKYRTLIWLGEEVHQVNCESNILLVEHGDFISQGFELIPGLFSKTSGIVIIGTENHVIKTISIKSGLVYEGNNFQKTAQKLYYPGEILFSNIPIETLSFCEQISIKSADQLLIRPVQIYEFPYSCFQKVNQNLPPFGASNFQLEPYVTYSYKSNQIVKGIKPLNLINTELRFPIQKSFHKNIHLELRNSYKKNSVQLHVTEKLSLINYLAPNLRYQVIQPCLLIQKNQFINAYMTLGYLESTTVNPLEIIKFKIKKQKTKQIFLISNKDCVTIPKRESQGKKVNDFITSKSTLTTIGKIIIQNNKFVTIQRGRPYFFPNYKNENLISKTNLQYKFISSSRVKDQFETTKKISLNYYNLLKASVNKKVGFIQFPNVEVSLKSEFSKLFIKNQRKLYSSLIPQFFKKFSIVTKNSEVKIQPWLRSRPLQDNKKINRTLLIRSSQLSLNTNKVDIKPDSGFNLTLLKFVEQPFLKSTKAVGLYSITEDYFEQDVNSVFCKNMEFIEAGKVIGLLNLEKEITGDIVQGLPRIEEILEARKKNLFNGQIPTSQKKGLLIQKTSLDPNFEFKKLGTPIKENDKINPHKLLNAYFNYYGLLKYFLCNQKNEFKYTRLLQNYEGSYKSFKKVQLFILNSVQSVYKSQGVQINNKHLEVIIKQMTTKVLITYEGNTPLLRREVIDLYHIQYINQIIQKEKKQEAYYIPLLLGITKAALNNPSFISAASFQETTRVLTMAAIDGRIDWLRGLKENIIIGHLIPAGTGSQDYRNCFKKPLKMRNYQSSKVTKLQPFI